MISFQSKPSALLSLSLLLLLIVSSHIFLTLIHGTCTSPIYCQGSLLRKVQQMGIFKDSKAFVDMPTKLPALDVWANFIKLSTNISSGDLHEFVMEHFHVPGYELYSPQPIDWKPDITLLSQLHDSRLKEWTLEIHSIWKSLLRQYNTTALCPGCVSSSIHLDHPFIIPGGRFREFYYWDSYWILEGLLISEMHITARGMLSNFLSIIKRYGFIPNGSRIYYLNRSQPPMLTQMIKLYIRRTGDTSILSEALPLLDLEYTFWMTNRNVSVKDPAPGTATYLTLNMYQVNNTEPRPESYKEDVLLSTSFETEVEQLDFYRNVATAAESGWDFSSRWFRTTGDETESDDPSVKPIAGDEDSGESFPSNAQPEHRNELLPNPKTDIRSMDIIHLIPLDLNALLYANEKILAEFHAMQNQSIMSDYYVQNARSRLSAMTSILYDSELQTWSDFNITSGKLRNRHVESNMLANNKLPSKRLYISDFSPLWFFDEPFQATATSSFTATELAALASLENNMLSHLSHHGSGPPMSPGPKPSFPLPFPSPDRRAIWDYPGGIPTSEVDSGQQWDFPNAWAPFQYYVVDSLFRLAERERGRDANNKDQNSWGTGQKYYDQALEIANRWIHSTYCGWNFTGHFFEKYDVLEPGMPGHGGEYIVQDGFGWTNAVTLMMIEKFKNALTLPTYCNSFSGSNTSMLGHGACDQAATGSD